MSTSLWEIWRWSLERVLLWHLLGFLAAWVLGLLCLVGWEHSRRRRRRRQELCEWQRLQACILAGKHASKGTCSHCGVDGPRE